MTDLQSVAASTRNLHYRSTSRAHTHNIPPSTPAIHSQLAASLASLRPQSAYLAPSASGTRMYQGGAQHLDLMETICDEYSVSKQAAADAARQAMNQRMGKIAQHHGSLVYIAPSSPIQGTTIGGHTRSAIAPAGDSDMKNNDDEGKNAEIDKDGDSTMKSFDDEAQQDINGTHSTHTGNATREYVKVSSGRPGSEAEEE
ncbi:hypothetical protein GQ43DRAFT_478989 [Delitschia confertaspora ATCC 74209]|uniref:Uncharacterized protein n=1 Tax=Delitschia confertaspora ATCC 74209 TaxID=1513339 RepID=A0A9P4JUL3_9PLEO|nr:hypothetical protein GQ43DRAFT_478989 [Delitschia confertaspora ATCC 74209]